MIRIIDASVAVKWFTPEPLHGAARALLDAPDQRIAPDWLLVEVANVLWKQEERGEIDAELAGHVLDLLPRLVALVPAGPIVARALALARRLHHPVHDCLYVALAEETGGVLVTADAGLARQSARHRLPVEMLR